MPSHPADPPSGRKRGFAVAVSILAVLAVAIILFLWIGRHNGPATESSSILKVGDQRGGAQALLRAAGELDHVPYTIEFALFPAASPLLEALGANAIDIGGIGGAPFAFAYASGAADQSGLCLSCACSKCGPGLGDYCWQGCTLPHSGRSQGQKAGNRARFRRPGSGLAAA